MSSKNKTAETAETTGKRTLRQVKRSIMRKVRLTGEVSALSLKGLMPEVNPQSRGGFIASAFRQLVREGRLIEAGFQDPNKDTGHKVNVYLSA